MTEKEIQIYTSGKENPNAYDFSKKEPVKLKTIIKRLHIRKKYIVYFFIIIFLMAVLGSLLLFNVFTVGELYCFLGLSNGIEKKDTDFAIYYLDVGQSDCSIILCEDSVMMIDSATINNKNKIDNTLMALDIKEIDYLVITHQHDDHIGNAESIIKKYSVKNIIMPAIDENHDFDLDSYQSLLNTIAKKGVNPISSSDYDSFMLGSAKINILSPNKYFEDLNDMSIVLKVEYGDNSFLFQGDAGKEVEQHLINEGVDLSADVIKIGHHGSNTASTDEYLSCVNPSACIIPYGSRNNFNHPNPKVIDRLEERNIDIYLTLYHGNLTLTSDGNTITIYPQKNEETKTYNS